jgi:hypothetical protein
MEKHHCCFNGRKLIRICLTLYPICKQGYKPIPYFLEWSPEKGAPQID